jgi:hypothetical protein
MTAGHILSPAIWRDLGVLALAAPGYTALVTTMAVTAVFSSKPDRREAALNVLRLLLPGRRQIPPS